MCGPFFKAAANRADAGGMDAGDGYEVAQRTREKSGFASVTLTAFGSGGRRRTGASREAGIVHHPGKLVDVPQSSDYCWRKWSVGASWAS
jgi:hypothetical protein